MSGSIASSDWESVGIDDCMEPQLSGKHETDERKNVIVEVPKGLLFFQQRSTQQDTNGHRHSGQASMTSSARLINGIVNLELDSTAASSQLSVSSRVESRNDRAAWTAHRSRPKDDDDTASWSELSTGVRSYSTFQSRATTTAVGSVAARSSASSVISNFDILSLSGRVYRRCKRCSYHNSEHATICVTCALALIANPCLDVDAQIAANLQLKEERDAFQQLLQKERKRKNLSQEPILEQANMFMKDIESAMSQLPENKFEMIPSNFWVILAMNFIGSVRQKKGESNVTVAYGFTHSDRMTMDSIRCYGFGPITTPHVDEDVEKAFSAFTGRCMTSRDGSLFPIPEESHGDPRVGVDSRVCESGIGWIVAKVTSPEQAHSGVYGQEMCDLLPLISFRSLERSSDDVQKRAFPSLKQQCEDFFQTCWTSANETDDCGGEGCEAGPSPKKTKCESDTPSAPSGAQQNDGNGNGVSVDDDAALAQAIAASEKEYYEMNNSSQKAASRQEEETNDTGTLDPLPLSFGDDPSVFDAFNAADFSFLHGEDEPDGRIWDAPSEPCSSSDEAKDQNATSSSISILDPNINFKRVQIQKGHFEGHIGKVLNADDSHLEVLVETIRSHQPVVMVARDRVKQVGGDSNEGERNA